MFIDINDENIIQKLKQNIDKEYVIHYTCTECGDQQVTYAETLDGDLIQEFNKKIDIGLHCTNCGTMTLSEEIDGIEII